MATLNVKDALSYLDQVKVQFAEHPDVYNRFLDIMKDFKSQSIDTPGVIERVSTLFRGHPSLIQGFNTFLPPGYRIECSTDPSEANLITVTTPSGTTTQKDGAKGIAGAVRQGAAAAAAAKEQQQREIQQPAQSILSSTAAATSSSAPPPKLPQGSIAPLQQQAAANPAMAGARPHPDSFMTTPAPTTPGAAAGAGVLSQGLILGGPSGPSSLHASQQQQAAAAAAAAASAGSSQHPQPLHADATAHLGAGSVAAPGAAAAADGLRPPLEFNHAINYVNKIKQRFSNDPKTYKQFLEILQTYQKEGRAIQDVYAQVTVLFEGAKDLLDEFKQFLPDTSAQPGPLQPQLQPTPATSHRQAQVASNTGSAVGAKTTSQGSACASSQRGKKRAVPGDGASAATAAKAGPNVSASGGRNKKAKHGHKTQQHQQHQHQQHQHQQHQHQQHQHQQHHHPHHLHSQAERMMDPTAHGVMPPMDTTDPAAVYGLPPSSAQQIGNVYAGPDGLVPSDAAATAAAGLVPSNVVSAGIPLGPAYAPLATLDEVAFFDRVKKHIDDRGAYLEFLKLLNLYTQDVIDVRTLVDKAAAFIGGHRDLFATFKSLCGYEMGRHGWLEEEEAIIENTPSLERPRVDLNTCEQFGASYRRLPKEEVNLACSGRDAMCWEVLNDEWVSHPTWASEGEGFNPHKKNVYEDALYRSEEERHEYDYHIEANLRTIALLEPIAARIAAMDEQERVNFRLKPGLGGQSRSIYQRVLRKIYGRDAGAEIVAALHDSPSTSIPVVLARLRQKDEEWKRAQREWNKVWRVVDERNWWKSLDHRGVSWKTFDKKAITTRGLVGEIELRRAEDIGRRWMKELGGPRSLLGTDAGASSKVSASKPGSMVAVEGNILTTSDAPWHLAFDFSDRALIYDVIKLALSHLDRGPSYSRGDIDRIEIFIRSFLPLLFGEEAKEWEDEMGLEPVTGVDDEEDEGVSMGGSSTVSGAERRRKDENLRTKVLRGQINSRPEASTVDGDTEMRDGNEAVGSTADATPMEQTWIRADTKVFDSTCESKQVVNGSRQTLTRSAASTEPSTLNFFCSTSHYAFLRLFQLAYVRLGKMKRLAAELGKEVDQKNEMRKARGQRANVIRGNPIALRLGLQDRWGGIGGIVGGSAAAVAANAGSSDSADSGPSQDQLPLAPVSGWELHPSKYYAVLLDLIEKLFDGDSIDQNMYEESVRFMFGIEGYVVFTIDKLLGGLVKTAQSIINDSKCTELQALLDRDRQPRKGRRNQQNPELPNEKTSQNGQDSDAQAAAYRHQIATRMRAECLIGKEEHLFRVGWSPSDHRLGIQMLSRDDPSADLPPYIGIGISEGEEEKLKEKRWLYYISSYALWAPTEGLAGEAKGPFLKRNVDAAMAAATASAADALTSNPDKASGPSGDTTAGGSAASTSATTTELAKSSSTEGAHTRFITEAGLEIKVCLSSYRIFFAQGTEDTFARVSCRPAACITRSRITNQQRNNEKQCKFRNWLIERRNLIDRDGKISSMRAKEKVNKKDGGQQAQDVDAKVAQPGGEAIQAIQGYQAADELAKPPNVVVSPSRESSKVERTRGTEKVSVDANESMAEADAPTTQDDSNGLQVTEAKQLEPAKADPAPEASVKKTITDASAGSATATKAPPPPPGDASHISS